MSDEELYQQYLAEEEAKKTKSKTQIMSDIRSEAAAMTTPDNVGGAAANALTLGRGLGSGIFKQAAEGGLLGAAQSPDDRLKGFLTGGALQGGIAGVGKAVGKIGDVGMQIAVGRKKYTPGVGTELADAGVVGTQRQMQNQVARGLKSSGEEMGRIASEIQQPINASKIGQEISSEASAPYTGGGIINPAARDAEAIKAIQEFGQDVSSRGQEPAIEALARRRAAGSSAYSAKSGEPKQNVMSQLSKREQQKYSEALKEADPRMVPVDTRYAALKKGEKALNEEPTLPRSLLGLASMTSKSIPGGSLATSAASQAAVKGGRGLEQFLAPMSRQIATSAQPQEQDPDYDLYQQYLKETGQR